ncbi:MAG: HAD-IA family hydrolase [Gammaproteobacteria bacterium]|nr:HAD-IA family hydrolase [Gammaproteobacteria bacterium]
MTTWRITGRVMTGLGQGAGFTGLDWVRNGFVTRLGIDPWPGTLNLQIEAAGDQQAWYELKQTPGIDFPAGDPSACDARCYAVRIDGRIPAAIVLPDVPGYPQNQVELVASLPLRDTLELREGDTVDLVSGDRATIATAIFDVDGTLVNSVDAYHIAAGRAAEPFGYEVTRELVREALNTQQAFWQLVLPEDRHDDADLIQQLRDATMRHWPVVLSEHVSPFDGVAETLSALRDAGTTLGIYSGSRGESFAPLERAGLLDLFDAVLTASDVSEAKPHPEGVVSCMAQLNARARTTAYIGDTAPDMLAAEAAGVLAIGMLTGAADSATLSRAGAHRLAASHPALLDILL